MNEVLGLVALGFAFIIAAFVVPLFFFWFDQKK
jgi:hypothetical protein